MMVLCCKVPIVLVSQNCLGNAHSLYTVRHKLSITTYYFRDAFRLQSFQKNNQFVIFCYPSLPLVCGTYQNVIWSFCRISTVSCIHQPLFLGETLKRAIA